MITRAATLSTGAALLLALAPIAAPPALACACCTNEGQRTVVTAPLDSYVAGILAEIRFAPTARLYVGNGEPDDRFVVGGPSEFEFSVAKSETSWSLAFAQKNLGQGNVQKGTLTFTMPKTLALFEVDPREPGTAEGGLGPALYKEGRLTAPAKGTGMFEAVTGGDEQATLIVHGRGLNCTEAAHFNAWTLLLSGPKATASFYGTLDPETGETPGAPDAGAESETPPPAAP